MRVYIPLPYNCNLILFIIDTVLIWVYDSAKVAMTPGLIEHGLKQVTKSEQVQVEEVTVKIKVCNDQDKCNTLPLKDKKTLRFEVGSFNPEELFHFFRYRVVVT